MKLAVLISILLLAFSVLPMATFGQSEQADPDLWLFGNDVCAVEDTSADAQEMQWILQQTNDPVWDFVFKGWRELFSKMELSIANDYAEMFLRVTSALDGYCRVNERKLVEIAGRTGNLRSVWGKKLYQMAWMLQNRNYVDFVRVSSHESARLDLLFGNHAIVSARMYKWSLGQEAVSKFAADVSADTFLADALVGVDEYLSYGFARPRETFARKVREAEEQGSIGVRQRCSLYRYSEEFLLCKRIANVVKANRDRLVTKEMARSFVDGEFGYVKDGSESQMEELLDLWLKSSECRTNEVDTTWFSEYREFSESVAAQRAAKVLSSFRVVGITDGDTITVLDANNGQFKIRLAKIDAPEKRQAFGERSRQRLSELVFGKEVNIQSEGKDKYGRILAVVYAGELEVNLQMVKDGMAWHYKHFDKTEEYEKAEVEARNGKVGLWVDQNPIEPWEFWKSKKGLMK